MGKVVGRPKKVARQLFDGKSPAFKERDLPIINVSGGAEARKNHLDTAVSRKKRQVDAVPEGVTSVSGSYQKGVLISDKKIKRNGIGNYRTARNAKVGTVAENDPELFNREAKKDGHD